jgi:hypothetical protein
VADREVFSEINYLIHDEYVDLDQLIQDVERSEVRLMIYHGQPVRHASAGGRTAGPTSTTCPCRSANWWCTRNTMST